MPRKAHPWFRTSKSSWYVTMHGKQVNLGITDPDNSAAALVAWETLKKQQQIGEKSPRRTVTEAVADYLTAAARRVQPHTLEVYRWYLGRLADSLGTEPVSSLTAERLEEEARRAGWSSSTRHNYLATALSCLRRAGVNLRIRKPPKTSAGADSVIPENVFRQMLLHVKGDWQALLYFLWHTGARPSEAASATVENTDWEARMVRLKEHKTAESGHDRLIYLDARAYEVCTWQREKHGMGFLFRSRIGSRFRRQAFVRMFRKLSGKVGSHVNAYGFRHTFATRALASGESDTVVAALLGHASTNMIHKHYSHTSAMGRQLREAAERIGKAS